MSKKTEQDIEVVKRQIVTLKQQLEADIDVADELRYTDEEIEKLLKKLPVVMFHAAQSVVLRLIDAKEAKRRLKKELAVQMMKANLRKTLTAADDRKAWAQRQPAVERAEIAVINTEAELKMAEFHYTAYDNLYMAIKKLTEMRIEQNRAQERANR